LFAAAKAVLTEGGVDLSLNSSATAAAAVAAVGTPALSNIVSGKHARLPLADIV
jgi:hypothetical protein